MLMKKTILKEKDYIEFYKTVLYGDLSEPLKSAIKAAYKDMQRTIHGISKNPYKIIMLSNAEKVISESINKLLHQNINNQNNFDKWHKSTCDMIIGCFEHQKFTYGQAQKWLNMTLKYLSMFDHKCIETIYEYCHVPIDNYIIECVGKKFKTTWSRIDSYDEYIKFQEDFRSEYNNSIPLDKEFYMWINISTKQRK